MGLGGKGSVACYLPVELSIHISWTEPTAIPFLTPRAQIWESAHSATQDILWHYSKLETIFQWAEITPKKMLSHLSDLLNKMGKPLLQDYLEWFLNVPPLQMAGFMFPSFCEGLGSPFACSLPLVWLPEAARWCNLQVPPQHLLVWHAWTDWNMHRNLWNPIEVVWIKPWNVIDLGDRAGTFTPGDCTAQSSRGRSLCLHRWAGGWDSDSVDAVDLYRTTWQ